MIRRKQLSVNSKLKTQNSKLYSLLATSCWLLAAPAHATYYEDVFEKYKKTVVPIRYQIPVRTSTETERKQEAFTAGVVVSEDGKIAVSGNLLQDPPDAEEGYSIEKPTDFEMVLDGKYYPLKVVGNLPQVNVAFLQTEEKNVKLNPVIFDTQAPLSVGDTVMVIGLLPEQYVFQPFFEIGILNARVEKEKQNVYFHTNLEIKNLMIGGLVVLLSGEGKPAGILGQDPLFADPRTRSFFPAFHAGYPLVFPAALFSKGIPAAETPVEKEKGWLGITLLPLEEKLAKYWDLEGQSGVVVTGILENSPAKKAGLKVKDVILSFNGKPVTVKHNEELRTFTSMVLETPPGTRVPLTVYRDKKRKTIDITITARPKDKKQAENHEDEDFGIKVSEITFDIFLDQNLDSGTQGVYVTRVQSGGFAGIGGLYEGDIILEVNGEKVKDLDTFKKILENIKKQKPKHVLFFVQRYTLTTFVAMEPVWE